MDPPSGPHLRRLILQRLESLQRAGVLDLPRWDRARGTDPQGRSLEPTGSPQRSPQCAAPERRPPTGPTAEPPGAAAPATTPPNLFSPTDDMPTMKPLPLEQRVDALATLCRDVAACRRCQELASTRTQTVFGVGDPMSRLVFLGEAPGADEDRLGEPFVGRAGQLLNKIIQACTLEREQVYILNILKCRPPGNRNPESVEAANCRAFLQQQLDIIRPEFICCLGAVAAQNLLGTTTPIGQLRGRFHQFGAIKVMATYHPAYLLRNPNAKRATWDDMRMLMSEMGIEIPKR